MIPAPDDGAADGPLGGEICPSCGGGLAVMPGQAETSEMIDVVEVSYRVVEVQQQKYVCACGGCVETAPGPDRALPGSRYSLAFAIKVVLDKYLDHIPLERQVRILERHDLIVTSQTLWDMACAVARRLAIVDHALYAHVLAQPVIGLDQTGWPRREQGAAKPWQMWCLTAPGVVESTPAGAEVWADGALVGTTPVQLPPMTDGTSVDLKLVRDGHVDKELTVVADADKAVPVTLEAAAPRPRVIPGKRKHGRGFVLA